MPLDETSPLLSLIPQSDYAILRSHGWMDSIASDVSITIPEIQNAEPVSVGILTYNRCDDIRMVLTMLVYFDTHPNKQIIVVDNASHDGTEAMIREYFPSVEYYKLETNMGTIGRNIAISKARHRYYFSLDDDSLPATPTTLYQATSFLHAHPEITVISTRYFQPRTGIDETAEAPSYGVRMGGGTSEEWYQGWYMMEGASCGVTSSLQRYGLYDSRGDLWGADGIDVQLSLYRHSCIMAYVPMLCTLHFKQWKDRSDAFNTYRQCTNIPKLFAKQFTRPVAFVLLTAFILRRAISYVQYPARRKSIADGLRQGIRQMKYYSESSPKFGVSSLYNLRIWILNILRW